MQVCVHPLVPDMQRSPWWSRPDWRLHGLWRCLHHHNGTIQVNIIKAFCMEFNVVLQYLKRLCWVHLYDVGAPGKTDISSVQHFNIYIFRLFDLKKVRLPLLWWWLCLALALAAGPSSPTTSSCSSSSTMPSSSASVGTVESASVLWLALPFRWSSWTSYFSGQIFGNLKWAFAMEVVYKGWIEAKMTNAWKLGMVVFGATGAKVL